MLIRDVIRNREPYSTQATVTVQEAKGVVATRPYGPAPKRPVATKVAQLSAAKR